METEKLYYADPFLTEFDARVLACEAEKGGYQHPFKDVPQWADKYVDYAYEKGYVKGYNDTTFGGADTSRTNAPLPCPWARRCMGSSTGRGASTTCSSTPASTSARG